MRLYIELQDKLGFTDAQMARFLEVSRAGYSSLKNADGNQHMRLLRQLAKIREHLGDQHRSFYSYVEKVALEEEK